MAPLQYQDTSSAKCYDRERIAQWLGCQLRVGSSIYYLATDSLHSFGQVSQPLPVSAPLKLGGRTTLSCFTALSQTAQSDGAEYQGRNNSCSSLSLKMRPRERTCTCPQRVPAMCFAWSNILAVPVLKGHFFPDSMHPAMC